MCGKNALMPSRRSRREIGRRPELPGAVRLHEKVCEPATIVDPLSVVGQTRMLNAGQHRRVTADVGVDALKPNERNLAGYGTNAPQERRGIGGDSSVATVREGGGQHASQQANVTPADRGGDGMRELDEDRFVRHGCDYHPRSRPQYIAAS